MEKPTLGCVRKVAAYQLRVGESHALWKTLLIEKDYTTMYK